MMSEELNLNLCLIVKQKGGGLDRALYPEFKALCREELNFSPDMGCGRCIYRQAKRLHEKLIVGYENK